jgi:hypothetical protein
MIPDPKTETTEGAGMVDVNDGAFGEAAYCHHRHHFSDDDDGHGKHSTNFATCQHAICRGARDAALSRPQATPDPRIAEMVKSLRYRAAFGIQPSIADRHLCSQVADALSALQQRVEQVTAELRMIDAVMSRRPALDQPTRWQNIEKAINMAAKADEAIRARESAEQRLDAAQQIIRDHESGVANLHRVIAHEQQAKEAAEATIASLTSARDVLAEIMANEQIDGVGGGRIMLSFDYRSPLAKRARAALAYPPVVARLPASGDREREAVNHMFSVSDLFGDQSEDAQTVAAITAIVREADESFQKSGGSSRHWVRDCFLPRLNAHGYRILSPAPDTQVSAAPEKGAK